MEFENVPKIKIQKLQPIKKSEQHPNNFFANIQGMMHLSSEAHFTNSAIKVLLYLTKYRMYMDNLVTIDSNEVLKNTKISPGSLYNALKQLKEHNILVRRKVSINNGKYKDMYAVNTNLFIPTELNEEEYKRYEQYVKVDNHGWKNNDNTTILDFYNHMKAGNNDT